MNSHDGGPENDGNMEGKRAEELNSLALEG